MKIVIFELVIIFMVGMVSAIPICIDNEAPSAPGNLGITGSSENFLISWSAAIDSPTCSGIFEYVISRDEIELGRVNVSTLNFIDNSTLEEGEYDYTVYAIDLVGRNTGASIKNKIIINHGGKSSGGSGRNSYRCEVNWTCENWTECIDDRQLRICIDLNECGTDYLKSETTRNCEVELADINVSLFNIEPQNENISNRFSMITGAVIGAAKTPEGTAITAFGILSLLGVFIIRIRNRKNK